MARVGVVIPAGGKGRRFGRKVPKQFLLLRGKPVLQRTVAIFDSMKSISEIVVVAPREYVRRTQRLLSRSGFRKVSRVVAGGATRQSSVWNGLNAFTQKPDVVLVHDAVRPLVSRSVVLAVVGAVAKRKAAVVGVPVRDTIKIEGRRGIAVRTIDRDRLWALQTPQGFRYDLLVKAHKSAQRARYIGTDESSLVERLGIPVRIVEGDERNLKITTSADLELAEFLMK